MLEYTEPDVDEERYELEPYAEPTAAAVRATVERAPSVELVTINGTTFYGSPDCLYVAPKEVG